MALVINGLQIVRFGITLSSVRHNSKPLGCRGAFRKMASAWTCMADTDISGYWLLALLHHVRRTLFLQHPQDSKFFSRYTPEDLDLRIDH
jgi:hypothetical protein